MTDVVLIPVAIEEEQDFDTILREIVSFIEMRAEVLSMDDLPEMDLIGDCYTDEVLH